MKKTSLFFMAAFMSCLSFAQSPNHLNSSFICSYYGEPITRPVKGFASSADAKTVIAEIIDVIGLEPTFEIRSANIPNAAAIVSAGKRYILYNPQFIKALNSAANDKWAAIAIIAHEIGHHLNGHTLTGAGSRPESELEADLFSGFVLRKMGASLEQSQLSMKMIANDHGTSTHPGRLPRLTSIENGWNKAEAQLSGTLYTAKSIPRVTAPFYRPVQTTSSRTYVLNPKYIQFDVFFNADKSNPYYITTSNNLVSIRNSEVIMLGKLVAHENANFPLAIQSEKINEFYISKSGSIINNAGRSVGYLKLN